MNKTGKTLTIFLVVISVLMISLTTIAVFFFLKEVDLRKAAEANLQQLRTIETKLQTDLKEAGRKIFVYEEKIKESDGKIENLMEEIDLEKGLREETKKENRQLKDDLEKEVKAKEELRNQLNDDLAKAQDRLKTIQTELDSVLSRNKDLEKLKSELEAKSADIQKKFEELKASAIPGQIPVPGPGSAVPSTTPQPQSQAPSVNANQSVALGKIVVTPNAKNQGKVISVDKEADFVIVSIGEKTGVKKGSLLSIYRGKQYLGDIKVSRVLPEMSAADFVPPLKNAAVKKDDQVVMKE